MQMKPERSGECVLGRDPALSLGLPAEEVAHSRDTLAVPALRNLAVGTLLLEHDHDPVAVDDFRMVIHAEDAGHRAGRITGEFDDREAVARLALPGDHVDAVSSRPDEIEEPVVDDLEVAVGVDGPPPIPRARDRRSARPSGTVLSFP